MNRIASVIGNPIYADECIAKQMRISFARMLVEVNVTKPLPEEIEVIDPKGRSFQQVVRYGWKPLFCNKCQVIGHVCPPAQRRNDAQQADQVKQQGGERKTTQN